jgi:deaminated glutathione amidase
MFKVALVQMRSSQNMALNLKAAETLVRDAAATGASYVLTPEVSNVFEPDKDRLRAIVLTEADDPMVRRFSELAQALNLYLHAGSVAVRAGDGRIANRSLVFAPSGKVIARYDKIHLFDIDLPNGESYRESATYAAGTTAAIAELPEVGLGLCICYDVRFPRLANAYATAGATVLSYPAAFTVPTGEAHWHVLLRARAIETGSYVLAAAQGGDHDGGKSTFGHSLAISPWGEILAEAGTEPCVITAEIEHAEALKARTRIPALRNARDFTLPPALKPA